jgi:putative hydrolase of the HAD superfamily
VGGADHRADRDQGRAAERSVLTAEPAVVLFDLGGVVLTNGWDHVSRRRAEDRFGLDAGFEARHAALAVDLDTARVTLDAYLDQVVFDRPRAFTREDLIAFMRAESQLLPEGLAVLDEVVAARRYLVFALNNESRELNAYRIATFDLARRFTGFLSSCYLGHAKPERAIYERALEILQRPASACVVVDDRATNIAPARELGMIGIHHTSADTTRAALRAAGVEI